MPKYRAAGKQITWSLTTDNVEPNNEYSKSLEMKPRNTIEIQRKWADF